MKKRLDDFPHYFLHVAHGLEIVRWNRRGGAPEPLGEGPEPRDGAPEPLGGALEPRGEGPEPPRWRRRNAVATGPDVM